MAEVLKQRIAINTHQCQHTERKQCHCGHHDPDGAGHGNHEQGWVTCQDQENHCFHRIPGLQHAAEDLA